MLTERNFWQEHKESLAEPYAAGNEQAFRARRDTLGGVIRSLEGFQTSRVELLSQCRAAAAEIQPEPQLQNPRTNPGSVQLDTASLEDIAIELDENASDTAVQEQYFRALDSDFPNGHEMSMLLDGRDEEDVVADRHRWFATNQVDQV